MIPPARTGRESRRRMVVTTKDQTNRGIRSAGHPLGRILRAVVIKLIEPKIEETPARWREKMARSTDGPLWEVVPARGG